MSGAQCHWAKLLPNRDTPRAGAVLCCEHVFFGGAMADFVVQPHDDDPTTTSKFTAVTASHDAQPASPRGLDAEDIATISALPATSALLIARSGASAGARFLLNADSTTVGRHPRSDIFLDDVTVSRKHAFFVRSGEDFFVQDTGSLNGTYVNLQQVEEAKLSDGDEVRIGKFRLTFYASPQAGRSAQVGQAPQAGQ